VAQIASPNIVDVVIVRLFEASQRLGGKVGTEVVETEHGRFLLEQGADSFLTQKPWALQLALELGLRNELIGTNDYQRNVFVLKNKRLVKMPDGTLLMVPTRFWPFATTGLISPWGKMRAGLDLLLPKKHDDLDESLSDFVRRRLGQEMLDYFAEPLLAGIYNGDPDKQSMQASFGQFVAIEKKYGSLIRGMLGAQKHKKPSEAGVPNTIFVSFKNGMQTLVDALQNQLAHACHTNTKVLHITQTPERLYELAIEGQPSVLARSVIVTIPAAHAAKLLNSPDKFNALRTTSSGCIYLAYKRSDVAHPLKGFGVVIPKIENRALNAVTWTSSKLDGRAPSNTVLLRVFFGGSKSPELVNRPDIEAIARAELSDILGIQAPPILTRVHTYHHANPQYDVGHLARVQKLEQSMPPGLLLAGSSYRGVGLPDCVHQAGLAANKAISFIDQIKQPA
jgi:oxygen-dependent protoporphyrinogen oxidase